jgi:peptidoglycan/xylan/chitin deacetylase (PgdA/CDA1 family)
MVLFHHNMALGTIGACGMTLAPMVVVNAILRMVCRRGGGVIINYHTLSREETRLHITFLGQYFDFISHDELLPRLRNPKPRPFCYLTFDDGKKSHATTTAPALRELGVPAGFYIPTGFLSQGNRPLWFDRYSALSARTREAPAALQIEGLKRLPLHLRDQRLDEACRRYGIDADMTNEDIRPMSWDDVRALHAQGFTIGSHSEWHAILPAETMECARADISQSMTRISSELRTRCVTFSFPNGNYTRALALYAQECGAETVFTTEPTWAGPGSESWRLPRIQLFAGRPRAYLAAKVSAARVARLLSNPDGSGRAYARTNRSLT